jgi:hypothetical protein
MSKKVEKEILVSTCQSLELFLSHLGKVLTYGIITRGVSHCGLAIYIKRRLKAKEELWKLKYFTIQKYNLQINPLQETKILQDIITLCLISSFNTSQNINFQKSSYKNRPGYYLRAKIP